MPALTLPRPPPHQVRASTANAYPQSYYVGQQGRHLNLKQMCLWECTAVLHAGIIFFITFNAWGVVSSAGVGVGNAVGVGSATPHADGSDADMYTVRLLHTLLHLLHLLHLLRLLHLLHSLHLLTYYTYNTYYTVLPLGAAERLPPRLG